MTNTVSDVDACTKRLEVAIPRAEVTEEIERAYRSLSGRVRIKGFRKGKVPRRVLERYYGEEVQAEVLNRVISISYRRLLEEKGMRPVGEPNVTDIEMDGDAPELTYKATVEVIPPFELGEYKGIELHVHRHEVTDEVIDQQIESLRQRAATFEDVDRAAKEGDYVLFDIEGFEGGNPVPGTRGENQALMIGADANEKELEDGLVGMKAGEEKELDVEIPESADPGLAGKTMQFKIEVKTVKEAHPPELDEDFVRSLGRGFSTVEEMRKQVAREMEEMEDANTRSRGISDLLNKLVEAHPFEVPPTLIQAEADEQIREVERRMRHENPEAQIGTAEAEKLREEVRPQAEERVRQVILVNKIQEKEGILAAPEEIEEQIRVSAVRYNMEPEKLKKRMLDTGSLDTLVSNINYNKTVNWLYDQAKVEMDIHDAAEHEEHSHDEESSEDGSKEEG